MEGRLLSMRVGMAGVYACTCKHTVGKAGERKEFIQRKFADSAKEFFSM